LQAVAVGAAAGIASAAASRTSQRSSVLDGVSVSGAVRREDTILRLGGKGDNWYMTWAADDEQLVALCDGYGFTEKPTEFYNSHLFRVAGDPAHAVFREVSGYPKRLFTADTKPPLYYGFGTLAVDGKIYQFVSTLGESKRHDDSFGLTPFIGAKLIYSPDAGKTWCNQDGSSPVTWEGDQQRSRKSLVFFEEPQYAFSMLSILQMGRDYRDNRDGYVYVYSPGGVTEGTMNQLVMFRVPKTKILERAAYRYFAGHRDDGSASWTSNIEGRATVHTFPAGWVNKTHSSPFAWQPSVVYNAALDLYLMASSGMGCGPDPTGYDGDWYQKPSYLGFWTARHPWGPWKQIHEEIAWLPGDDPKARCYVPQIAPKWIAPDGKSFWLVWSDFQNNGTFWHDQIEVFSDTNKQTFLQRLVSVHRRLLPYYAFNVQRVDLIID
jgi:hypothetical protein